MTYLSNMEKQIALSNILTPVSVGIAMISPIQFLTIISITSSIILNLLLIIKHTKNKKDIE